MVIRNIWKFSENAIRSSLLELNMQRNWFLRDRIYLLKGSLINTSSLKQYNIVLYVCNCRFKSNFLIVKKVKLKSTWLHTKSKTYCNKLKLFFFLDSYYSCRKVKIKSLHCLTFIKIYHSQEREDTTLLIFPALQYMLLFRCTRSEFAFTHQYCCTLSQFESERTILNCTHNQNSLQTLQPSCHRQRV